LFEEWTFGGQWQQGHKEPECHCFEVESIGLGGDLHWHFIEAGLVLLGLTIVKVIGTRGCKEDALKRLITCMELNLWLNRGDLGSTSNLASLSYSDVQINDVLTLGSEDEVGHMEYKK